LKLGLQSLVSSYADLATTGILFSPFPLLEVFSFVEPRRFHSAGIGNFWCGHAVAQVVSPSSFCFPMSSLMLELIHPSFFCCLS